VDLTTSYESVLPVDIRDRYDFRETRNAAAVLAATDPAGFDDLVKVLRAFRLMTTDLTEPLNRESEIAARLNKSFRDLGWREARVDTKVLLSLRRMPHANAGEVAVVVADTEVANEGYKVDNMQRRVAIDVEWNAKDGNLDRDLAAYRALYEWALIDVAVIVTRTHHDLRSLATNLRLRAGMPPKDARKMLSTTTTTNMLKLEPRLSRGDGGGGCPTLAVAISARAWENAPLVAREDPDEGAPS
jgi:hypothetical protein